MKCGRICLSHGGQLPVLHRRKGSQHFMNQAKFHSTFPILLLLKSLNKTYSSVKHLYQISNLMSKPKIKVRNESIFNKIRKGNIERN